MPDKKRKENHSKIICTIILSLCIVFSNVNIVHAANEDLSYGDFLYQIINETEKTVQITQYLGEEAKVSIPEVIQGYSVIGFGSGAYSMEEMTKYSKIKEIHFPSTLRYLMAGGLQYWSGLTEVILPEGVEWVGGNAFYGCTSLERIVFPASVTSFYGDFIQPNTSTEYVATAGSYAEYYLKDSRIPVMSTGAEIPIADVTLEPTELTLTEKGSVAYLQADIIPANATNRRIHWISSNENAVKIAEESMEYSNGPRCIIMAEGTGESVITGTTMDGRHTVVCTVTVILPEKVEKPPFADVSENDWFYSSVRYAYENGIMTGLDASTFGPNDNLVRAQFASIMYRLEGSQSVEYTPTFRDVGDKIWYTKPILWANSAGIIKGYTNGYFGPGDNINREQIAVIMYRYAEMKGYDTTKRTELLKYLDSDSVSDYAKKAMQWCVAEGIINGKENGTRLDPRGYATRAECAAIMKRFIERY